MITIIDGHSGVDITVWMKLIADLELEMNDLFFFEQILEAASHKMTAISYLLTISQTTQ